MALMDEIRLVGIENIGFAVHRLRRRAIDELISRKRSMDNTSDNRQLMDTVWHSSLIFPYMFPARVGGQSLNHPDLSPPKPQVLRAQWQNGPGIALQKHPAIEVQSTLARLPMDRPNPARIPLTADYLPKPPARVPVAPPYRITSPAPEAATESRLEVAVHAVPQPANQAVTQTLPQVAAQNIPRAGPTCCI